MPGIYWHFVDVMWIVVYTDRLHHLRPAALLNPLRSEAEAFRFLIYVVVVFAVIVVLVLLGRALF